MSQSLCWARLPRSGLGNKLFVWARALIFSRINGIPLYVSGFNKIRVGPLLRGESGRYYFRQFARDPSFAFLQCLYASLRLPQKKEPCLERTVEEDAKLYVFNRTADWRDLFAGVRDYRDLVEAELLKLITPAMHEIADTAPAPVVSVHVRLGDFRFLAAGEDFAQVGLVRTPFNYFEQAIAVVRAIARKSLPITIFSDGKPEELSPLLRIPDTHLAPRRPAATDLLLMSRSRIIIPSAGSTFSYWAGFLSRAAIMLHPQHIHAPIRPADVNERFFEGPTPATPQECPLLLQQNIQAIAG